MKHCRKIIQIIILFCTYRSYSQQDTSITYTPIQCETSFIGDGVRNFSGGIKKGNCYLGMTNIKINIDTKTARLWKGGNFYINAVNTSGDEPSIELFGDFQTACNIEAGNHTYFQEIWFKQLFKKSEITIGLQDLCTEFIYSKSASIFLNSSFGVHSNIASNLPVPIFPLTSLGLQINQQLNSKFVCKVGIFDGLPTDFDQNPFNLNWKLQKEDGFILISELDFSQITSKKNGIYKIGVSYHNKYQTTNFVDSVLTINKITPNFIVYAVADKMIYKNESGRNLSLFAQASIGPKRKNYNWLYLGTGLNFESAFRKRKNDVLGFSVNQCVINNVLGNETNFELTYKAFINENLFIQPDFQYIINPAGTTSKLKNTLGGFLRFGLNF